MGAGSVFQGFRASGSLGFFLGLFRGFGVSGLQGPWFFLGLFRGFGVSGLQGPWVFCWAFLGVSGFQGFRVLGVF